MPDPELTQQAITRLRRIEGQVRGIQRMLEQEGAPGDPCDSLLTQVLAVRAAVEQVGLLLLQYHLECCVLDGAPLSEAQERALTDSLRTWSRMTR
jgi:DNA-binding FrmR family transcriptional regulator